MDQMNLIDINEFTTIRKIGKGIFCEVFKIEHKKSHKFYAAKILHEPFDDESQQTLNEISQEIDILTKIHHPSIITFIGLSFYNFFKEKKPVIITEFSPNGSLHDVLTLQRRSLSNIEWNSTRKLINIYGIASAMSYLHSHQIIHRNLKTTNILIDQSLCPKISDFGLSKIQHSQGNNKTTNSNEYLIGTPAYIAPEIWTKSNYTKASDVYSYGILLYEIMTIRIPFENFDSNTISENVLKGNRPEIPKDIPESYRNLIERCCSENASDRPSFDQILNELKRDERFTESVNLDDFLDYVDYVDNSEKIIQSNKCIIKTDEKNKRESKAFHNILSNKKTLNNCQTENYINTSTKNSSIIQNCNEKVKNAKSIDNENPPQKQNDERDKNKTDQPKNSTVLFDDQSKLSSQSNDQFDIKNDKQENNTSNYTEDTKFTMKFSNKITDNYDESPESSNNQTIHKKMIKQNDLNNKSEEKKADESASNSISLSTDESRCNEKKDISFNCKTKSAASQSRHNKKKIEIDEQGTGNDFDDANSLYEKGMKYLKGEGVGVNKEKAAQYFKMSADKGNDSSMNIYANMLKKGDGIAQNKKEASRYYKMSSEKGNISAMNHYSKMLYNGDGIPVDKKEASRIFKLSGDKGNDASMNNYAHMLRKGDGIQVNKAEAAYYYKKSADKGNDSAMNSYANMLYEGDGIPINKAEAAHYYKMSADKGNVNAIKSYANMLHNGDGIPRNKKEASIYYRKLDNTKK